MIADARADVYACGVMLYELLTGEQQLLGESAIQTAYRHVHEDIPSPSQHAPWLPVEIDEAVAAMTAREVDERPRDARATLVLVRRAHLQIDEETLARRVDPPKRPEPEDAGEEGATASLAAAAGAAAAAGSDATEAIGIEPSSSTVALPVGAVPARDDGGSGPGQVQPLPTPAGQRRNRILAALLAVIALAAGTWWWIALGPGAYTSVPDVTGKTAEEAITELAAAGLTGVEVEMHDDEVPEGLVVTTDPGPGQAVIKEGEVDVIVSLGILLIEVPDLSGLAEADALAALDDAEIRIGDITRPYDMEVPEGFVVGTDPPAGEVVPHFQPIAVAISQGREPVDIPSVVGATRETAESELEAAGLVPQVETDFSDTVPAGSVMEQDPEPGPAFRGDTVTITVSEGPPRIPVPDVVGKQLAAATGTLEDAGFEVRVERVLGGFFGTVRSSTPAAGTVVQRGSTITLTVV